MSARRLVGALLLTLPMAAIAVLWLPPATSAPPCDLYASPSGSDAGNGSLDQPYRTVPKLVSMLSATRPTGCLKGYPDGAPADMTGLYELTEPLVVSKPGITLRSAEGQVAQIKGAIVIESPDVTLARLVLDNRFNDVKLASPVIDGHRTALIDNDITSRGGSNCVTVRNGAQGVVIRHNRIHNCTHGVRIDSAVSTVVEANLIHRNSGPGLGLRPNADQTDVTQNVFDRNRDNVVISGNPSLAKYSDGNDVHHNILSDPGRFNLTDGGSPMGDSNKFRANCVYKSGDVGHGMDDVTSTTPAPGKAVSSGNTFTDPRYVARRGTGAYQLQPGSPCETLGGTPVDFAATARDDARPSQSEALNLRPNVLFIVTDDQRADTMHVSPPVMPQTLKWFRDGSAPAGIVGGSEYVNAYAPDPLCCPSRERWYRAIDLGFGEEGGKAYAIYLSAPADDWGDYLPVFRNVRDGFKIEDSSS